MLDWSSLNLLFDPWIEGPATHGSWVIYPPSDVKVEDLPKIDGIFISHEHSDHYHEPTLSRLDKNTPVYIIFEKPNLSIRLPENNDGRNIPST